MTLYRYAIGEPYIPGRTHWDEQVEFNCRAGAYEMRFFLRRPTSQEITDLQRGSIEFAFTVDGPIIFWLYRIGESFSWSDCPTTMHMIPAEERQVPPPLESGQGSLITLIVVDADTGLIVALRALTMSPHLSRLLREALARQLDEPFDQSAYDQHLARVYARSTSRDLLRAARARSKGGA